MPGRWALMHEEPGAEPDLPTLLARLEPVDLVLVEGFRHYPFPKLEVFRPELGKPPLWPEWPDVAAVASTDEAFACDRKRLRLDDHDAIATWIVTFVHSTLSEP
jgi:molybdopterin-guanine dinucleotide biosynthesis protein B